MTLTNKQIQLNLRTYYGYYMGNIDGVIGKGTKDAIRRFQKSNGLKADGIYGVNTENKLIACIKDLQSLLKNKGYSLSEDGIVGDKTLNAIKDFQKKSGLKADGIVGTNTFNKLRTKKTTNLNDWSGITHFTKKEFACKDGCGFDSINPQVVRVAEKIRHHFGDKPLIVTSGCRCAKHNALVGGVKGSKHVLGRAIDFYIKGVKTNDILAYTKQLVKEGTLKYTYTGGYKNGQMNGIIHINI